MKKELKEEKNIKENSNKNFLLFAPSAAIGLMATGYFYFKKYANNPKLLNRQKPGSEQSIETSKKQIKFIYFNEILIKTKESGKINHFKKNNLLGEGKYGKVYQGVCNGVNVAIKEFIPINNQINLEEYGEEVMKLRFKKKKKKKFLKKKTQIKKKKFLAVLEALIS